MALVDGICGEIGICGVLCSIRLACASWRVAEASTPAYINKGTLAANDVFVA